MGQEQTKLTKMACPACGFQVFNRRYPKCERCKSDLPASLVYSADERRALLETEEEQLGLELKRHQLRRSRQAAHGHHTSTAPVVSVLAPTLSVGGGLGASASSGGFASGGGGVFDGGGGSGSFAADSGTSSGSD